jgi:hypothetical protein
MVASPSREVEVTFSSPSTPWTAPSIGSATWRSTMSGEAPGYEARMNAAGKSRDGNSCCFSFGIVISPNRVTMIATSATSPRFARLILASLDIRHSPLHCG